MVRAQGGSGELWVTSQGTDPLFIVEGHGSSVETVPVPGLGPHITMFSPLGDYAYVAGMRNGDLSAPYLSQYIFTGNHYSYMYVPGAGPRKRIAGDPNKPTDAEKVEAYKLSRVRQGLPVHFVRVLVNKRGRGASSVSVLAGPFIAHY